MSSIKSIIGTFAVLFAIQPIASWAAEKNKDGTKSGANESADKTKSPKDNQSERVVLSLGSREKARAEGKPPICAGGL